MELGVDIAQLNVVNMRNVPPTPANYAQRSGRAGRSGQPAFVYTYCSAGSPHDQWFFQRPERMVSGSVTTPRTDVANEELLRSHIHAIWLTETQVDLGSSLKDVLDVQGSVPSLKPYPRVQEALEDRDARARVKARALASMREAIEQLVEGFESAEEWIDRVLERIPRAFDDACERWKGLYRSARAQYDRMAKWCSLSNEMSFYGDYHGMGFWGFPISGIANAVDLIQYCKKIGIKSFKARFATSGGTPDEYVSYRLMWDAGADVEALLHEFYDTYYGAEAGKLMRDYHDLLYGSFAKYAESMRSEMQKTSSLGVLTIGPNARIEPVYAPIREKARALIDAAYQKAGEGKTKQRVEAVSNNFKTVELTLDAMAAYKKMKGNLNKETAYAFKAAVDAREALLDRKAIGVSARSVRGSDGKFNLPVTKAMANHMVQIVESGNVEVVCKEIKKAPEIDGKLSDETWKNAGLVTDFREVKTASKAKASTKVWLAYDKKSLYVGIECAERFMDDLIGRADTRDGAVWNGNDVELFLSPDGKGKQVFQFGINYRLKL